MRHAKTKIDEPAARPSSPSVRFTPLVVAKISSTAQTHHPTVPSSQPGVSNRVNDSVGLDVGPQHRGDREADGHDEQARRLGPLVSPRLRSLRP